MHMKSALITCGRGVRPNDLPEEIGGQTTDVSDQAVVAQLKERVVADFRHLSILVNNAGVQIEKTILESSDED